MKWLFDQLEGPVYTRSPFEGRSGAPEVDGWEDRDDITVVV